MRASTVCLLGLALLACCPLAARAQNCGCEAHAAPSCCGHTGYCRHHCHHACHHGHHGWRHGRNFFPEVPPAGPVTDVVPTGRMLVPVTYTTDIRRVAIADDVRYVRLSDSDVRLRSERSCDTSTERLDVLEGQVQRLTKRVDTLQDTLSDHYNILRAIKAKLDGVPAPVPGPMPEER